VVLHFYSIKFVNLCTDYLKMNSTSSYFYAAIVAVVAVHAVLGLFVYVAWNEGKKSTYKTD
jgi:hypothetical protein